MLLFKRAVLLLGQKAAVCHVVFQKHHVNLYWNQNRFGVGDIFTCFYYAQCCNYDYCQSLKKNNLPIRKVASSLLPLPLPAPSCPLHTIFLHTWTEKCFAIKFFQSLQHVWSCWWRHDCVKYEEDESFLLSFSAFGPFQPLADLTSSS